MSLAETLHILGNILVFVPRTLELTIAVAPAKACRWTRILVQILASGLCSQRTAVKMAGRLSFAVSASTGRVGRAYIKTQANMPLRHGASFVAAPPCRLVVDQVFRAPAVL